MIHSIGRLAIALLFVLPPVACGKAPSTPSPMSEATIAYASTHFLFHYTSIDAGNIAATAATLERHYARILNELGADAMPQVHVTLYADHAALAAATQPVAGVVPSWAAGLATARDQIHLMSPNLPMWGPYDRAVTNLVHEFAHCVSLQINGRVANNPRWLWESVALYEARQFVDPRSLPYMTAHQPPTFQALTSVANTAVYDMGYLVGEFIVERWSRDALRELIVRNGDTSALGLSLADFEQQWFSYVRDRYGL